MPADTEVKTSGSRESLRDLEVVGLEVKRFPSSLKDEGVNEQDVLLFMGERLGKAPVAVISRTGAKHRQGSPTPVCGGLAVREGTWFLYVHGHSRTHTRRGSRAL
jgi:hypothetical protein